MLKTNINEYEFRDMFRAIRPDNFSYSGLGALFGYLEELSEDIGEDIEMDVIAICCDYSEYESLLDFNQEYYELCELIPVIEFYGFNSKTLKTNEQPSLIVEGF